MTNASLRRGVGCGQAIAGMALGATAPKRGDSKQSELDDELAKALQVADNPPTKSGKIVDLAVRNREYRRSVENQEALANPEARPYMHDRSELQA